MKAITTAEFGNLVGQGSGVVLVDFWAERCGPCKVLKPGLEQLAASYGGACFYGVDVDEEGDLSMQFGIRSIPTVMIFVNGELKEKIVGVQPIAVYKETLDKYRQSVSVDAKVTGEVVSDQVVAPSASANNNIGSASTQMEYQTPMNSTM